MKNDALPVLFSFRRCPYAMRARLAIAASGLPVELREVVLREKPQEMLIASPKATVPVLVLPGGDVLEESLDVIHWALDRQDREGWLDFSPECLAEMRALIVETDGPFKQALDRYKYPNRFEGTDVADAQASAAGFIAKLERQLDNQPYLFGGRFSYADAAILPFVRQFAHVDRDWFRSQDWPNVITWLEGFLESSRFATIMEKYPQWKSGEAGVRFGG